ncbi:hypothetical protein BOTBODRAFT_46847 [Botryobasidium botryosum FD-172 SS1]|uniref:Uncharacterized protein n=1 Tax=Botryobasidium botryosum (strain FD-172 SS1) TaxID=930990 RepID=A0A067MG51_BOTB1|nr:hypothetical protein BOTBODRAFT_46847 [Botryobasidium botryosum FD-172 SS1]
MNPIRFYVLAMFIALGAAFPTEAYDRPPPLVHSLDVPPATSAPLQTLVSRNVLCLDAPPATLAARRQAVVCRSVTATLVYRNSHAAIGAAPTLVPYATKNVPRDADSCKGRGGVGCAHGGWRQLICRKKGKAHAHTAAREYEPWLSAVLFVAQGPVASGAKVRILKLIVIYYECGLLDMSATKTNVNKMGETRDKQSKNISFSRDPMRARRHSNLKSRLIIPRVVRSAESLGLAIADKCLRRGVQPLVSIG